MSQRNNAKSLKKYFPISQLSRYLLSAFAAYVTLRSVATVANLFTSAISRTIVFNFFKSLCLAR